MASRTTAPPELASRLRLTLTRLSRQLRQQSLEGELTPSQLSALSSIERHGPVQLSELAAIERVQPPSMTKIVAKLEEHGLVERSSDPADRRVSLVRASAAGERALRRSRSRKEAWLAARLDGFDGDERARLEAALPVLERLLDDDGGR